MNIAEFTIKNKVLSGIVILVFLLGGWSAYKNMPRFEDPEFTIRVAQVITYYPGGSPLEVAEEVTEPLEQAIQQMQEVDVINSTSSDGVSEINVEIKYDFSPSKSDLQIIWTKLRNKVKDAERSLPLGASSPIVVDDYGDVYGLYYFVTGEGYSPAEHRQYAKQLQKELLQVEGVAKVAMMGESQEVIYVEIARANASLLGISKAQIYQTLSQQNAVAPAGDIVVGDRRLVIDPSGAINSVDAIRNLLVAGSADGKLIYLKDIADVWRGYETPPNKIIRYNGKPAIALGVSGILGGNIVKIGKAVERRISNATSRRPVGMEIHDYYHQGNVVELSVNTFVINVLAALFIVIITLLIFMGLHSSLVIGAVLLLTIAATLTVMDLVGIPMHRISLGALIIALGMMVDNAIVVTEGILVGVQQGRKKLDIAKDIVTQTKWPLLGGTLVGIIAFAPIGFAPGNTAEYTNHLFWVILISLMFSWLFAVTLTPLFCHGLFKEKTEDQVSGGTKKSALMLRYRRFMQRSLDRRWFTIGLVITLFALSLWGFRFTKPGFFPSSTTPQLVVDYWLPQGTDITKTDEDIKKIEDFVSKLEGVNAVQASVGSGGLRYMLIYPPESPNSAYGQLLVRVDNYKHIRVLMPEIQSFIDAHFPNAQSKVWRFTLGPGGGSKIEATFKGPTPAVLRQLAARARAVMSADGRTISVKDDWRQPVSVLQPIYSEIKGQRAGISREDLTKALQVGFSGEIVGAYREGDDLIPIVERAPEEERTSIENVRDLQVLSSVTGRMVPITQVTDGFRTIWRDGTVKRENRIWTIKAQCDPYPDELASELLSRLRPKIEAIPLPDGYTLEWDGEYGDSSESNADLLSTIPYGFMAMLIIVFVLFGQVRQPVVIWLVVPLALIGVTWGLVITQTPLEFMGILGLLSLSGLLIKNAIVLVDQIDLEIRQEKPRYDAVIDATLSRVRPVMMGTLTTVLGVLPLFFDAFFKSMSVVLVFGLLFATLLTLVVVPVLYAIFFSIRSEEVTHD